MSALRETWEQAVAARERIIVEDIHQWTRTEGMKHRLSVGWGRRTIMDMSSFPIVCDKAHAEPDGRDIWTPGGEELIGFARGEYGA